MPARSITIRFSDGAERCAPSGATPDHLFDEAGVESRLAIGMLYCSLGFSKAALRLKRILPSLSISITFTSTSSPSLTTSVTFFTR